MVLFLVFQEPPTVELSVKSGRKSTAAVGEIGNSLRLWIHSSRQGNQLNKQSRSQLVPKMLWLRKFWLALLGRSVENL
ncbi:MULTISPECIES: hypothetical protein [unclassified Microcoleus]|uniref:hypothetical protein n=1 Tax=unclassified Microcoleus TaxID=2642155 RepID=UPI002FD5D198